MNTRKRFHPGAETMAEQMYKKTQANYANEGGFCADDDDASTTNRPSTSARKAPILLPDEEGVEEDNRESSHGINRRAFGKDGFPLCNGCDKQFADSYIFDKFNVAVCNACREQDMVEKTEKYSLTTRSDAKKEFLLTDDHLDSRRPILRFISKKNPHNPRWGDMKLYLTDQVRQRAIAIHGSVEEIKEIKDVRMRKRQEIDAKKREKQLNQLRRAIRGSRQPIKTGKQPAHKHVYEGEEEYDQTKDMYCRVCVECEMKEYFEKM